MVVAEEDGVPELQVLEDLEVVLVDLVHQMLLDLLLIPHLDLDNIQVMQVEEILDGQVDGMVLLEVVVLVLLEHLMEDLDLLIEQEMVEMAHHYQQQCLP